MCKALEVDDQNVRRGPKLKFFTSLTMLLATRAIPSIILRENLFLAELLQTFIKFDPFFSFRIPFGTSPDKLRIGNKLDVLVGGVGLVVLASSAKQSMTGFVMPVEQNCLARLNEGMFYNEVRPVFGPVGIAVVTVAIYGAP